MNKMLNYFQFINEAKTDNESSDLAAKYVKLAYKYLLIKCPMWITFFSKLRIISNRFFQKKSEYICEKLYTGICRKKGSNRGTRNVYYGL